MVEIADFNDRDSFGSWLRETDQPREACVALAHRAAMRVLPLIWASQIEERRSPMSFLRANLVAGVAGLAPARLLTEWARANVLRAAAAAAAAACAAYERANSRADAAAAYGAARAAYADADADADPDADAAYAADAYADTLVYADAGAYADAAARAAYADAAWAAVRSDCERLVQGQRLEGTPLFLNGHPDWFASRYRSIQAASGGQEWSFWHDWFERAIEGKSWHWPTLIEIALQEDHFWEGTDVEINARIRGVVARDETQPTADPLTEQSGPVVDSETLKTAKENSLNAEEVFVNAAGKFDARPLTDAPGHPIAVAIDRALNMVSEMRAAVTNQPNHYSALRTIADVLATALARPEAVPLYIYEAAMHAIAELHRLTKAGELPPDDGLINWFRSQR